MTVRESTAVFEPVDVSGVAAILQKAKRENQPVIPVGGTGSATPHHPEAALLSLKRLCAPINHRAGDLTATIPAGARLNEVNARLRAGGQWLPLDSPASNEATIGGLIATNASGPRRHRYGAPRDLIIGIEIVLADGRVAKAGGQVVKNVAGYDLARMMCGSYGSLAVITAATFKLSPIAPVSCTVVGEFADLTTLDACVRALTASPATPSTIELASPPHRLLVRFETTPVAAEQQAGLAAETIVTNNGIVTIVNGQEEDDLWSEHERFVWSAGGTVVNTSVLPRQVRHTLEGLAGLAGRYRLDCRIGGRAALGVLQIRLAGNAARHADAIREFRQLVAQSAGSLVVQQADPDVWPTLDRWGDLGDALALHKAVKQQFDPAGILNPGGGPGGL